MEFFFRRKWISVLILSFSLCLFTGCGASGEGIKQATELINEQEYKSAIEILDTAILEGADERLALRSKGIAYMGLADYEQALDCFKQALSHSNGIVHAVDYDLNYYIGLTYTKLKQFEEAERVYSAILDLKNNELDAHFLRGGVRLAQRNLEGARVDFDAVTALAGKDYDKIIDIYEEMDYYGYRNEGKEYLNQLVEKYVDKMDDFNKGKLYYYIGNYNEAAKLLDEARKNGEIESALYLGMSYEAIGEYDYALNVYSSYIEQDEASNPEIYNRLGVCNVRRGDYTAALKAFQTGKVLGEGKASSTQALEFNEIVAYEHLGDFENARQLIANYVVAYPDDTAAIKEYNFLLTR